MVLIEEIRRPEDLPALTLVYRSLLPQTPDASRVQALDWLVRVWGPRGRAGGRPRVMIVRCGGTPVGVLPLVVLPERTRLGTLGVLRFPWPGWAITRGPIGPNPTATLAAGLRHLRATPRDWDLIDLRGVDVRGGDFGRTRAALERLGYPPRTSRWHRLHAVVPDDDRPWTECAATAWRVRYHRAEAELARRGRIDFEPNRHGDDPSSRDLEEPLEAFTGHGNQRRDRPVSIGPMFADQASDRFEEAPGVVRATLRLDGRPVAMCWACRWEGRVDALGLAFTGAAGDHSPARVLLGRWIADAQARGDRTVLFGPGWPDWITGCCTLTRGSVRYTHFPVTARAQVARWSRWTPAATA